MAFDKGRAAGAHVRGKWKIAGCLGLALAASLLPAAAAETNTTQTPAVFSETPEQRDARLAWWQQARFGMFIHWGLYAAPAGEWKGQQIPGIGEWIMHNARIPAAEYAQLANQFNPVEFNARKWARLAKAAGMKYIVITAKHHDGFAMYGSKVSPFNIVDATPFHRDPMKELAAACRKEGLKLCFYYSQDQDWHEPDASGNTWDFDPQKKDFARYFEAKALPQVRELLTNYGPLGIIWFDTPMHITRAQSEELDRLVRGLQPKIIVNNRIGNGLGDYGTPEQTIPGRDPGKPWETCMTLNDTWGFKKNDQNWKSTRTLIRNLIECASKSGNFLLNVGPTAQGAIPEASIERLQAVGKWMKVNSEAIYGTTGSPFKRLPFGRATQKPGKLYLFVYDWPADGQLLVPGLRAPIQSATLLADRRHKRLPVAQEESGVTIALPEKAPDADASVIALTLSGPVTVTEQPLAQAANGRMALPAGDCQIHGSEARVEDRTNAIGYWTHPDEWVSWEFALRTPGEYEVVVEQACDKGFGGSEYAVTLGEQQLAGTVQETGSWTDFTMVRLGRVQINAPGKYSLAVKPTKMAKSAVMNLRQVTLQPVK